MHRRLGRKTFARSPGQIRASTSSQPRCRRRPGLRDEWVFPDARVARCGKPLYPFQTRWWLRNGKDCCNALSGRCPISKGTQWCWRCRNGLRAASSAGPRIPLCPCWLCSLVDGGTFPKKSRSFAVSWVRLHLQLPLGEGAGVGADACILQANLTSGTPDARQERACCDPR